MKANRLSLTFVDISSLWLNDHFLILLRNNFRYSSIWIPLGLNTFNIDAPEHSLPSSENISTNLCVKNEPNFLDRLYNL